ncbi:hypothetical protein GCM10010249_12610 [Streptomyces roseolilacinus]|uniref:Uncharacterized protein n=1 Tax=Streptomyces roseolilacinus TaxID=66904 RepID=A0A918AWW1_9ACTN|nr:hypothetical protein GCM10010249_12610 [Streptomyces roseolilacinus]
MPCGTAHGHPDTAPSVGHRDPELEGRLSKGPDEVDSAATGATPAGRGALSVKAVDGAGDGHAAPSIRYERPSGSPGVGRERHRGGTGRARSAGPRPSGTGTRTAPEWAPRTATASP